MGLKSDKIADLKALCAKFEISQSGTKAQMVRRLVRNGALKQTISAKSSVSGIEKFSERSKREDLVEACRKRFLTVGGNKEDMFRRLQHYEMMRSQEHEVTGVKIVKQPQTTTRPPLKSLVKVDQVRGGHVPGYNPGWKAQQSRSFFGEEEEEDPLLDTPARAVDAGSDDVEYLDTNKTILKVRIPVAKKVAEKRNEVKKVDDLERKFSEVKKIEEGKKVQEETIKVEEEKRKLG